jgi:uncharacterized protein YllA (UPF0747 family)
VVESAVLPTLAYVGGPAELSYFAQLGCLFREHGIAMPLVVPRYGVSLIEAKVQKVLDKQGLDAEAFAEPVHELATRLVREEMPEEAVAALRDIRQALLGGYDRLLDAAVAIDATLKGPIGQARNHGLAAAADAEKKIAQHLKQRNATLVEQLEKAAANLYPHGAPQERVFNALQYLVRYGPELLDALASRMEPGLAEERAGWAGVECA